MATALDVASYFLLKAEEEGQELLSNLKLQKLVYFAQGLHLAVHGTSIFRDQIKAWDYGPVVPSLYGTFKHYGAGGIPVDPSFDPATIGEKTRQFLEEVLSVFGQFSAVRLMEFTHDDQCWKDAYPNGVITNDSMRVSLKRYIKNGKEQ